MVRYVHMEVISTVSLDHLLCIAVRCLSAVLIDAAPT
jgi:hypothetical protein